MSQKSRKLMDYLKSKAVFNISAIKKILSCDSSYASLVLYRLYQRKEIKKITKNRYTTKSDIWLIATNIYYPSYLSFWSASQYYNLTEQILNVIQVAVTSRKKDIFFENYKIKFIPLSKKQFFGYKKIKADFNELFVVEKEKLLIDAFIRPTEIGNINEIIKIIKNTDFDYPKLTLYLKKINNQSLIKRVGFLIEEYKGKDLYNGFSLNRNYTLLNPFSKKFKKVNAKWRIKYE